jgi:uncharacterized protein YigE (DUF2233 family)
MVQNNKKIPVCLLLLWLCMASLSGFGQARIIEYRGHRYAVYVADYPKDKIQLFWRNGQNEKLRSLGNLKQHVNAKGHELLMATNAGMYTPENVPCGLYIENGRQVKSITLATNGTGNFFMQPNGVFLLTKSDAKVVSSQDFSAWKRNCIYATQSGPMLVHNGVVNSNFTDGSANINIRSGVGVNGHGRVVFAISQELVNFYDFACLFKDDLKCDNALFLDGAISRMYLPQLHINDTGGNFGAMIGVVK